MGENTEKLTFSVPIEKEIMGIDKNRKEIAKKKKKKNLIDYNLLIAHNLWQAVYQILLIIFPKKFIELNINSDMMIKNVTHVGLNINIATFS